MYKLVENLKDLGSVNLNLTNGCFDVLHYGHFKSLRDCKDISSLPLLILLNSDSSVQTLKGPDRPIQNEFQRAYQLSQLETVDFVYIFSEKRITKYFNILKPIQWFKGSDYIGKIDKSERQAAESIGTTITFLPPRPSGLSTTEILKKNS